MEYTITHFAHVWDLSPAPYWPLRLLSALLFGPLLEVLWIVGSIPLTRSRSFWLRLHH